MTETRRRIGLDYNEDEPFAKVDPELMPRAQVERELGAMLAFLTPIYARRKRLGLDMDGIAVGENEACNP